MAHYTQRRLLAALCSLTTGGGRRTRAIAWASFLSQIIVITAPFANERIGDRIEFEAKSGNIFCVEYGPVNEPSQKKYGLLIRFEHAEGARAAERVSEFVRRSAIWRRYDSPGHRLDFCFVRQDGRGLTNRHYFDALSISNNVSRRSAVINEVEPQISIISLLRSVK